MLDYKPMIKNIHGKFYEMTADYVEPSIPYDRIVDVLKQGGYDGYILSVNRAHRPCRVKEPEPMMDNKMIVEDSLEKQRQGLRLYGRLPYYRGLGLSMVEDIAVSADGEPIAREDVRFHVRGKTYPLDEMESVYDDCWNFGEKAKIIAMKPGGLAAGKYRIAFAVRMRGSYLPFVPTTKDSKELALAA